MPSAADLTEIYDAGYFRDDPAQPDRKGYADYRADEPAHRRNARRRLDLLAGLHPNPGRLLDVGCAAGFFVAETEDAGWSAEGIDVAEDMISWGQRHVSPNLALGTFADYDAAPGSLNVVTMWDYIEHSINPRSDLDHARTLLAADGVIALSTGNIGSTFARLTGKRWHLLTPHHHNYFFSIGTLARLLRETGFEPIVRRHYAAWYSAQHLAYKLEGLVARNATRAISHRLWWLGRVEVPVNLFDIVTLVGRRPG